MTKTDARDNCDNCVGISYLSGRATDDVAEVLLGISKGNPAAWDEVLLRYSKVVSATVRSFGLQESDTLDAIQTTWLRLAENVDQVQYPERLGGWLATTARRECLRILRQAGMDIVLTRPLRARCGVFGRS